MLIWARKRVWPKSSCSKRIFSATCSGSPTSRWLRGERAADEFFPHYGGMMSRIGRERGWPPMSRMQFDQLRSPRGAVVAGGPAEVAEKILYEHDRFGHQRFLAQMSVGGMPHEQVMRSIELFGTEVAPVVRAEVERREAEAAGAPSTA